MTCHMSQMVAVLKVRVPAPGDILKAGSSTDLQSFKFGEFKDPNSYLPSPFILYKGVFRGASAQGTIELDNLCSSFTASAKPSSASTTLFDYLL